MDPVSLLTAVGMGSQLFGQAAQGPLGWFAEKQSRTYKKRELRELMKLRESLKRTYLTDPTRAELEQRLTYYAMQAPWSAPEMESVNRELSATMAGSSLASRRMVEQDLSAMGIASSARTGAIEREMERTRRILANMARLQAGSYAAQMNVQGLEQSRQALAQAMSDRYGTLAAILGAGV